jgi:broad specificity phosphatase PhoE
MRRNYSAFVFFLLFLCPRVFAQVDDNVQIIRKPEAKLVDVFGGVSAEDASARIDGLINEVEKNLNNKSILFVYCGRVCKYGEVEAHLRGIKSKLNFRNISNTRYLVLPGGYRDRTEVELWLIPENACPPIPKSTADIKDVIFKGTYKRKIVAYDCCD